MIRIARLGDIEEIMTIVAETIEDMRKEGNCQWSTTYPTKSHFEEDIKNNNLYIYEKNNEVAGFICISNTEDNAYQPLSWRKSQKAIVIHRFAVNRKYQRQSIGTKLVEFAEQLSRNKGINYVKVDTNSKNIRMNNLFQKLGFVFIGQITLRNLPDKFNCYDKILE
ncbi:MAG TPA: GNAT family N-acetyltransferase [Haloplasmataceae bacterium]